MLATRPTVKNHINKSAGGSRKMTDLPTYQQNPAHDSKICRICGEISEQGQELFHQNQDIQKLAAKICSYISVRLKFVRIYPNWICPGCQLQFESTNQFFGLIRNGQKLLAERFGPAPRLGRRPRKEVCEYDTELELDPIPEAAAEESNQKRRTKTPDRLKDSMQGNELEALYSEIGVTKSRKSKTKLIAHIKNQDGATLGEMLALPRNTQKTRTRYQCDVCKERFIKDVAFFQHVATHKNTRFECTECETSFPSKITFDEHQAKENHKGLGIIETPFTEPHSSDQDEPTTPDVLPPLKTTSFVCNKCNKTFLAKTALRRHQVIHSLLRPYKCDICPATFKLRSILTNHKFSHTGERHFKCHRCPKTFTHRQTLKAHLRHHDGLKPYLCTICKKGFSQLGGLQEHKRIHTGERPYLCLICGNAFRTSSQCRSHQRIHAIKKERPPKPIEAETIYKTHNCKTCGKLFTHRSAMVKHSRTHTGEKPYACHLCPRRFSDPSNFRKHRKLHEQGALKTKSEPVSLLKQSLTQVSSSLSCTDPDPDGLISLNPLPANNFASPNRLFLDILDEETSKDPKWGLLRDSTDPIITEIQNVATPFNQQLQPASNQVVCISYQDPMNPVGSKTTYYVMN